MLLLVDPCLANWHPISSAGEKKLKTNGAWRTNEGKLISHMMSCKLEYVNKRFEILRNDGILDIELKLTGQFSSIFSEFKQMKYISGYS